MKSNCRITAETAACAVLVIFITACGASTPSSAASPAKQSSAPNVSSPAIAEDLVFMGALSGRLTAGVAGDAFLCAQSGGGFVAGPILGSVGGAQVELNMTVTSFKGEGAYSAAGVSFDAGSDHYYPPTGAPGTLVIGADLRSGSVDAPLAVNTDPDQAVAHVSGSWRCPPGGS